MEDQPAGGASEVITTVTGGSKPLHRFLRGQPKSIGVVLVIMGIGLFMFGIPITTESYIQILEEQKSSTPFWIGTLFFICGLLYILSERNPSKKIITASLALNIISIIGVLIALVEFYKAIDEINYIVKYFNFEGQKYENQSGEEELYARQHYMLVRNMELVFCCHSVIGGVLLVTMSFFVRAALKSSRTKAFVVMRSLPSAE
ncbi:membrane-spanning 4-domains subfamily A member 15-like isoform X2 [Carassius auratus]|nr:membrane-spanning 4-domains subfamily A member 15-like isoform X2 [Carassius auratus]XP_026135085.1 membrane-spanning 4-domains subfamily A member 15-like isoform X2 [Carassius auratus]